MFARNLLRKLMHNTNKNITPQMIAVRNDGRRSVVTINIINNLPLDILLLGIILIINLIIILLG
jgi:hypothetical protein